MPMQIEIPPTLASLLQAIESISTPDAKAAIAEADAAMAAYDQLTPEQRAAYTHAIRSDIQTLKSGFDSALSDALHAYPGNSDPGKAVELAHLAVQAGEAELGHRLLQDAKQLGADLDDDPDVQELVAATPKTLPPLEEQLAAIESPPDAAAMNLIGLERLAAEDSEGAKAAFENAVDLDPDNAEHQNNLALTQIQAGLIRRGAERAKRALETKPDLSPANLALATACLKHAVAWTQDQSAY